MHRVEMGEHQDAFASPLLRSRSCTPTPRRTSSTPGVQSASAEVAELGLDVIDDLLDRPGVVARLSIDTDRLRSAPHRMDFGPFCVRHGDLLPSTPPRQGEVGEEIRLYVAPASPWREEERRSDRSQVKYSAERLRVGEVRLHRRHASRRSLSRSSPRSYARSGTGRAR